MPFYARLSGNCINEFPSSRGGKNERTIKLNFQFRDKELFEMYEGDSFDNLIEPFNEGLVKINCGKYRLDDLLEVDDIFEEVRPKIVNVVIEK